MIVSLALPGYFALCWLSIIFLQCKQVWLTDFIAAKKTETDNVNWSHPNVSHWFFLYTNIGQLEHSVSSMHKAILDNITFWTVARIWFHHHWMHILIVMSYQWFLGCGGWMKALFLLPYNAVCKHFDSGTISVLLALLHIEFEIK